MSSDMLEELGRLVSVASPNALRSKKARKAFARIIVERVGLWQPNVESFVEEMAGLNFYNAEDRLLFVQFAQRAL
jgi:monomeric isocitrate dehydrogenase